MKKSINFLIIILILSLSLSADIFKSEFLKANSFYEKGDFKKALDGYLQLEKNIADWKLYYNIGNSYFKLGNPVKSKIYFLKAKRLKPYNESIEKNIEIVEKVLNNNIRLPDPGFVSRVITKIESVITINTLSVILLLLLVILSSFEFLIITKGRRKKLIYGIIISIILLVIFSSYHIMRVNKFNKNNLAVVVMKNSKLRSGPGKANTVLFDISPGVTVKIVDFNRDWVQVTASPEIAGWINNKNIDKIK